KSLFESPLYSIRSLRDPQGPRDQRIRVAGSATLLLPDQSLFLRDGTGAIQARLLRPITKSPYLLSVNAETLLRNLHIDYSWTNFARPRPHVAPVEPGDRVEVVGTPTISGQGVVLCDAEYRRISAGEEPAPLQVSA